MRDKYIPDIQEAAVPEEGSWVQVGTEWALALSIPEWKEWMHRSTDGFRYVWMYDRIEQAYLFCFRLKGDIDRAIAFPLNHAGRLLEEQRTKDEFGIVLTSGELGQGSYLFLKGIVFKRHPGK